MPAACASLAGGLFPEQSPIFDRRIYQWSQYPLARRSYLRDSRTYRRKLLKLIPPIWKPCWNEIRRQAMSNPRVLIPKFKVGQTVDFSPSLRGLAASATLYKVTRVLPTEGRERFYRIKTIAEAFERVARESELLAASAAT
jgi:hypothetical protein